ncbi:MAG: hypothetical protein IT550_05000 [Novosphingobium sp.]|nr:hypothetical protein [Novosphingobium sp.]
MLEFAALWMLRHFRLFIIPTYALLGIVLVVVSGLPEAQLLILKAPQPYPIQGVMYSIQTIIFESIFTFMILRPRSYSRSWGRALIAFLGALGLLFFWRMGMMHAPTFFLTHLWWVSVGVASLLVLFIVSSVSSFKAAATSNA